MFVDIENFKGVIAIENLLTPYKRGRLAQDKKSYLPKEPISPEICLQVLKATNNPRNIKDMLQCIADLPTSEQAQFKEIVLAVFEGRQQPDDVVELGRSLASGGKYKLPFEKIVDVRRSYQIFSHNNKADRMQIMTMDEVRKNPFLSAYTGVRIIDKKAELEGVIDFPRFLDLTEVDDATLLYPDLSAVEQIFLKKGGKVEFHTVENLPHSFNLANPADVKIVNTDIQNCKPLMFALGAKVVMDSVRHIPQKSSFYNCADVTIKNCSLSDLDRLRFSRNARVTLDAISDLPRSFDVSRCKYLSFTKVNFDGIEELKFRKGAEVRFFRAFNIPPHTHYENLTALRFFGVDCSKCTDFNFQNIEELSFSSMFALPKRMRVVKPKKFVVLNTKLPKNAEFDLEGTTINFFRVFSFPERFDVSKSPNVILEDCNLMQFDTLTFMEGASVTLKGAKNLPEQVNFHDCSFLSLENCDLSPYEDISFRRGAEVRLNYAYNLPECMNFAGCSSVNFEQCDMNGVKKVFFWDETQMRRFGFGNARNWSGEVIFIGGRYKTMSRSR